MRSKIFPLFIFLLTTSAYSQGKLKSLCTAEDKRIPHKDMRIGRLTSNFSSACTVTMISNSCAITAGHCEYFMYGAQVEFDVPLSDGESLRFAAKKNQYNIDEKSITGIDQGYGKDWSVIRLLPNEKTKLTPGQVNGFYKVSFDDPAIGDEISIAGFGMVYDKKTNLNGTLQIAYGKILGINEYEFEGRKSIHLDHDVDTTRGNSGATLIRKSDDTIVGIHTHGGTCAVTTGNRGTLISRTPDLQAAIKKCLEN